ncbi:MAG TPA: PP2C family protein-serine/threonine phosphatase, partial [Thermoanaerobaculia bacterium]
PPALPWLDVAAVSLPATEVGGDYYDYFRVGDRLALVCGDVAGHGLASGIVLTALRSGFTLLRESLADPAAVLMRLHDLVEQTSRRRMLATAAVLVVDPATRRARIASAGHPPVMVRSNGSVRSIELFGPPLGVRLPVQIAQTEIAVSSGDVFVMHSDGVYETANAAGDLYGLDRLAALIGRADGSADDVLRAIVDDLGAFRGSALQDDDVTIVVAIAR